MPSPPSDRERTQPDDLVALVGELHAKAKEHGDEDAIAAAERVRQHAQAGEVDKVRFHAEALRTIAALAPLANAILTALADVGA